MAEPASIRVYGLSETLADLRKEFGDNGTVYRRTISEIKKAGNVAKNRAAGYLPTDDKMPRGFTYVRNNGWAKSRTDRDRAFPHYERRAAVSSLKVVLARERAKRTTTGWVGGKTFGIALEMKDAAGSIFDVAGNGRSRRAKFFGIQTGDHALTAQRSEQFKDLMRKRSNGLKAWKFRVVLPAVVDTRPDIVRHIQGIIDAASRTIPDTKSDPWSTR